ncbi:MAG: formimidoylglutamase [Spirochaetes bacterium]|nr:formimidoylglutamase [Spirochaetota bacterium]
MFRNYQPIDSSFWQGRVDDEEDYAYFRWHQIIQLIDLNQNELPGDSGGLSFCFLGFASDTGVKKNLGRVGAKNGPNSIRKVMASYPCSFSKNVKLYDAGNVICQGEDLQGAQKELAQGVELILQAGHFPVLLGGGHEIAFGHYLGLHDFSMKTQSGQLGIINFDAHFDIRPYPDGSTSGTMFHQIADLCQEEQNQFAYFCLGIQKSGNTRGLFEIAAKNKVEYILAADLVSYKMDQNLKKLDQFIAGQDQLYITICTDVISSAYAPGVSSPQPLGIQPDTLNYYLKHILKSGKAMSFDIAEVSPPFDHDQLTARLAGSLIFSVIDSLTAIK